MRLPASLSLVLPAETIRRLMAAWAWLDEVWHCVALS
jgi:hypothetical protein